MSDAKESRAQTEAEMLSELFGTILKGRRVVDAIHDIDIVSGEELRETIAKMRGQTHLFDKTP